ncbi:hypothetical protein [Dasania marina]|uniref:hypothetical protein n=1 Tax=Dasania marina TaxID=471499 RepID=UPI0004AD3E53|nr:hypothetical protein [Dasania marina]
MLIWQELKAHTALKHALNHKYFYKSAVTALVIAKKLLYLGKSADTAPNKPVPAKETRKCQKTYK